MKICLFICESQRFKILFIHNLSEKHSICREQCRIQCCLGPKVSVKYYCCTNRKKMKKQHVAVLPFRKRRQEPCKNNCACCTLLLGHNEDSTMHSNILLRGRESGSWVQREREHKANTCLYRRKKQESYFYKQKRK